MREKVKELLALQGASSDKWGKEIVSQKALISQLCHEYLNFSQDKEQLQRLVDSLVEENKMLRRAHD